ncbi:hypothetical protein PXD04_08145 [Methanosphaera sp. ISO3-F5]|uniref:hypothetical protein n=1 Tax=Methanosphaera sp. ISO3-F5 TaxID=1452353 RepID=UPI002B25ED4A|nr:hypothetical protein [Methanosphaera sp. ISO3-F5]WQH63663.1 hypothetical protein PXD04_08145 [Methanosphaera sp. ISO3-F5]
MEIIDILLYKTDNSTRQKRMSKTKLITLIVFVISFILFIIMYLTTPILNFGIGVSLIASFVLALSMALPTYILGWGLGRILNSEKPLINLNIDQQMNNQGYNQQNYNPNYNQENFQQNNQMNNNKYTQNYAQEFKNAIDENNQDRAENILNQWNNDDANYLYAKIIYYGMPPTDIHINELYNWLEKADNIQAIDGQLREWYRSSAQQVIEMQE